MRAMRHPSHASSTPTRALLACALGFSPSLLWASPVGAQSTAPVAAAAADDAPDATPLAVDAPVTAVTLYRSGAMITHSAALPAASPSM